MSNRFMVACAAGALLTGTTAAFAADGFVTTGTPSSNSPFNPTGPDTVNYLHDDGTAEDGVGINGTSNFDIIWLNRFTKQVGGEVITNIQAAIGSPLDTRNYNGLAMTVLLYSDPDGGSPANATVLTSLNTVVANGNTGLLNTYDITDTLVPTADFFVAVIMRGLTGSNGYVASIDQTLPNVAGVSYAGFTVAPATIDVNNLAALGGNLGTIEGFGLPGNWLLRATGEPVPEPASLGLLALGGLALVRRRA